MLGQESFNGLLPGILPLGVAVRRSFSWVLLNERGYKEKRSVLYLKRGATITIHTSIVFYSLIFRRRDEIHIVKSVVV